MSKKEILDNESETGAENEQAKDNNKEEKKVKKPRKSFTMSKTKKLENEIDDLKSDMEELRVKYLRQAADFDNFRKRTAKERIDLINTAAQDTITNLLPVLDDFDRAIKAGESEESTEPISDGVMLIYGRFKSSLQQMGLEEMDTNGTLFDPELHEAITEIPAPSNDLKGKIVDTVEKGYALGGKIIRYARVVVGK